MQFSAEGELGLGELLLQERALQFACGMTGNTTSRSRREQAAPPFLCPALPRGWACRKATAVTQEVNVDTTAAKTLPGLRISHTHKDALSSPRGDTHGVGKLACRTGPVSFGGQR